MKIKFEKKESTYLGERNGIFLSICISGVEEFFGVTGESFQLEVFKKRKPHTKKVSVYNDYNETINLGRISNIGVYGNVFNLIEHEGPFFIRVVA